MQSVLITGAASGIGRETARLFASAGWRCVCVDRNAAALDELVPTLPAPAVGNHLARALDLADSLQVAVLGQGLPPIDAILNNAGLSDPSGTPLAEQSLAQLDRLLSLNLAAPAAVVEACTPLLRPGARIVNVASGAGLHAIPWRGAYSPSKAGLIAQTQALARTRPDWCVSVLAPGFVRTELVDGLIRAGRINPTAAVSKIPMGRMAAPAEMAQALFFLASTGARPLHGQVMAFNGGSSIYGGSQPFPPATLEVLPLDRPLRLSLTGSSDALWAELATRPEGAGYDACLDLSALHAPPGQLLRAVHASAASFAARHKQQASLTLLLPRRPGVRWQDAGDAAAARMLVSTLACEWAGRALRVNALEVPADCHPAPLQPLLHFVCGAGAQFLTGQTLVCAGREAQEPA